ncbi:MAG: DUF5908 family protein [Bacteroidota bacterium]
MPIEVKEIIVQMQVQEGKQHQALSSEQLRILVQSLKKEIIADCTRIIQDRIEAQRER